MSDETLAIKLREERETIIGEINRRHVSILENSTAIRDSIISEVNAAREAGLLLEKLKADTKRGEWLGLFATAEGKANPTSVLDFDAETARRYMRLAASLPEPITDLPAAVRCLTDMMVAVGAIAEPHRDGKQNASTLGPIGRFGAMMMRALAVIGKERRKLEIDRWEPERKAELKEQLRPAAELYQTL